MWTRAELKDNAKKFFKFNYWKMVLVALILTMIGGGGGSSVGYTQRNAESSGYTSMSSPSMSSAAALGFVIGILAVVFVVIIIAFALSAFLFNPLVVGGQRFFVVSHYQKAELNELGFAFSNCYMNIVKTMFLQQLYIFLWSLLFIIPGIIKGYEYRMIPYILAENPGIDSKEAFAMSKQMMDGNKWNAFVLDLSFLGWAILGGLTCGILSVFYVNPYIYMTDAELYVALKEITYGGRNQGGYQNMYQPNNDQWNGNGQWNGSNSQWNNNQPMNNEQWNNNNQWNSNQQADDPWNNNTPT